MGTAVVKLTTRSGTNEVHGALFAFHRNDNLDARNFFAVENPAFVRNQFGGTVGGPIKKNKTFFFFSYQGTRQRGGPSPGVSAVPSLAERDGDLSGLSTAVIDPGTGPVLSVPLHSGAGEPARRLRV